MASPDVLQVTVEPLDDASVVRVDGEIDLSTTPKLRRELDAARAEGVTVLLDLSDVTFIDSTGLMIVDPAAERVLG